MKWKLLSFIGVLALFGTIHTSTAQSTAFTYQGGLSDDNGLATGLFDMTFGLFTTDTGGTAVSTVTNTDVEAVNGVFTTTLDFGAAVFDGTDYWLEVGVQAEGGDGFTTLTPRQSLNPTPYAVHSRMAMDVVNPTFLGTTMDTPLDFWVNNVRGLRIEQAVETIGNRAFEGVNFLAGSSLNTTSNEAVGVTVSGGGKWFESDVPNIVAAHFGTIGGGGGNYIGPDGGGWNIFSTISGGYRNTIKDGAVGSTNGGGWENAIGIGTGGLIPWMYSTIGGGFQNAIGDRSAWCTIGGGDRNMIGDSASGTIGGGRGNTIGTDAHDATIGGGGENAIGMSANSASIGGGVSNTNEALSATISGGRQNSIVSDARNATIGGGNWNYIRDAFSATISGGSGNRIQDSYGASISGGGINYGNSISTSQSANVGGGSFNRIMTSDESTIAGGGGNTIMNSRGAFVAGGSKFLGGGQLGKGEPPIGNLISNANHATIPGGVGNTAAGENSFAAGHYASALHEGAFVWADSNSGRTNHPSLPIEIIAPFTTQAINEFAVRAAGGVRFVTAIDTNGTSTAGVSVPAGGTGWSVISDRNMKENLEQVDGREVLDQVVTMPISTWNMKSQDPSIRHIGPMAQDFHAAFNLGESDRRINTIDADGVALAAIQGLNQKLEEKDRRIDELTHTVQNLLQRVAALEGQD